MSTRQPTATAQADTAADAAAAAAGDSPRPVAGNPLLAGFLMAHHDDPATIGAIMFVYASAVAAMHTLNGTDAASLDAQEA